MSSILKLTLATVLPILFSIGFYYLEKRPGFERLPRIWRQMIIGLAFGGLAVFSTEFGIDVDGAFINVRDAAPLCAGLIFGAPAGVIAGGIGGVERWFATLWGVGAYTRLACTLATVLAGLIGAGARKLLFDDKKPMWFYGLAIGMTTEVLHMLMIFLTNMSDIQRAFLYVERCAGTMILCNSLSVTLSVLAVALLGREPLRREHETRKIAQTFQRWLLVCVLVGFAVTSLFTYSLQTRISGTNADDLLEINTRDVRNQIDEASNANLILLTRRIAAGLPKNTDVTNALLDTFAKQYDVAEINVVSADGIITASTAPAFVGYHMADGEQSAFFLPLLEGATALAQSYQPIAVDANISRKYAGVARSGGGFVQVGYDAERFQRDIDQEVVNAAKNRHVGQEGSVIICNENWIIVSDRDGHEGENLLETGIWIDTSEIPENTRFQATVYGTPCYCSYAVSEGYIIVAVLPESEAVFSRDIAVYIMAFMEIIVFAALFAHIYFLIKRLVVDNIQKVNSSLAQITNGNLDVTVNVRANEEFASLSDDINSTVVTLKHYIAEAAARIDKELGFARAIQLSALPSVFPPYPSRKDFEIYACMDAAKEVGGDFYDFYLLGPDTLVFLIADVSGKGIPAAMFMMTAKTLIKSLTEGGMDIGEVFAQANKKLCEGNDAGMFVTAWMGMLHLPTGLVRYVNAGHNPPALRRRDGTFTYLRTRPNFILAGMDGVRYRKGELQLAPGDVLFLYTDGVTEATDANNALFGESRLLESLNAAADASMEPLCAGVKHAVDGFVGSAPQFDDITMLAVRLHHLRAGDTIALVPDADSSDAVSAFIDQRMTELDVAPKPANKIRIAVDEAYSNILGYSGATKAEVSCRLEDDSVVLVFCDNGAPYDPRSAKEPDPTLSADDRVPGGLGVFLLKKLMDRVEYAYENGRNVLTLSLKRHI